MLGRVAAAVRYVATGRPQVYRPRADLDAGLSTRRLKNWPGSTSELNTLMQGSGNLVVARARKLVQEDAYASSGQEAFIANLVGTGIRPSCIVEDPELRRQVMELWRRFVTTADASGATSFYGLQMQVAGALFDAGEAFIRRRPRRLADGLPVPLQLQVLEADHVDRAHTVPLPGGGRIRSGIEFDPIGRRRAYWMYRDHPGDATLLGSHERVPVPASEVLHVYHARRPGQIRGFPRIVPAMIPLREHGDYDDSEAARKKTTSMLAAFVKTNNSDQSGQDGSLLGEQDVDTAGVASAEWGPGTVMVLADGEDVEIATPSDVGGNYEAYQRRALYRITAGMGQPYSQVSSDVSQANYSSERAAQVHLRRRMTPLQLAVLVHQMVRPVWQWFLTEAVLSGAIDGDVEQLQREVAFILPKWDWVDPLKDLTAQKLAVDELWTPRSAVIEATGEDPAEVDRRIAQDQQREDALQLRRGAQGAAGGDGRKQIEEEERREEQRRLLAAQREMS